MNCPNCGQTLDHRSVQEGIEIDVCAACSGVWLDPGELDGILDLEAGRSAEAAMEANAGGNRPDAGVCPRDETSMEVVRTREIELDRCPGCGGLWVDGSARKRVTRLRDRLRESAVHIDGDPTLKDYIEKHSELDVTCAECSEELHRYTAWEHYGEYYCSSCADQGQFEGLERAMKWKEPSLMGAAGEYDEGHLLEVLRWMVDGLNPWK